MIKFFIQRFFKPPEMDIQDNRAFTAWLINIITTGLLVMSVVFAVPVFLVQTGFSQRYAVVMGLTILACAGVIALNRKGQTHLAAIGLTGYLWLLGTGGILTAGTLQAPILMGYFIVVLVGGLLLGARAGLFLAVASIVSSGLTLWLAEQGHLPPPPFYGPLLRLTLFSFFLMVLSILQALSTQTTRSALKRAGEELAQRRESEERLRLALEAARMGTWDWNILTGEVKWSEHIEALFGLQPGEFDGAYASYLNLIHPQDRPILETAVAEALANPNQPYRVQHRLSGPLGEQRWLEGQGRVYRDAAGQPVRMVGTVADITERKQAEEALRQAEEKYRTIVENALEGIFQSTPDGRFLSVNPAMARMYGYASPDEMIQSIADISQQMYVDPHQRVYLKQRLETENMVQDFEVQDRRKDGTVFWTSMNMRMVRDEQGRTLYYEGILADITAHKQAEEALRLSESRYRALVQNLPNSAIILFDPDLRFVLVDGPELARTGYSKETMEGRTLFEALPPEFAQMVEPNMRAVLRGENFTAELPFGDLFYTYHYVPLHNSQGEIIYGMILAQNITAYKQAEQALRESEERYRLISELISDYAYAYRVEPDGSFTLEWITADSARRMTGYDPMQEIGGSLILYHPDDQPRVSQHIQEAIQGKPTSGDYRIITKAGDLRWVHINRQPVWDPEQQRVVRFYGVSQDITERKQMELALEREHTLLRTVIDNLPDYIYLKNTQYQCLVSNLANARALGVASPNEVVGKTLFDFYPPEEAEQYNTLDRIIIETGQPVNQEKSFTDLTTGQRKWTWTTRLPFFAPDGSILGVVGISRDITENKEAQTAREQLIADLEAKNAELERFTYTVSHDLKNPLVTIGLFLGFLEKDVLSGRTDRVMADINRIKEAAHKMQRLLDELLELARVGRMMNQPQSLSFETIVHEALELVHGRLSERGVQVEVAQNLPTVYGDRTRLVEVMQNLVDNAAKYMGSQPQPRLEIGVQEQEGQPVFFVRDNGIGIEPQYHQKVFGLFDQLNPHSEGTGIGLALVKRIVEVHGGRIWVESAGIGQGSTFYLTLPDSHIK